MRQVIYNERPVELVGEATVLVDGIDSVEHNPPELHLKINKVITELVWAVDDATCNKQNCQRKHTRT